MTTTDEPKLDEQPTLRDLQAAVLLEELAPFMRRHRGERDLDSDDPTRVVCCDEWRDADAHDRHLLAALLESRLNREVVVTAEHAVRSQPGRDLIPCRDAAQAVAIQATLLNRDGMNEAVVLERAVSQWREVQVHHGTPA